MALGTKNRQKQTASLCKQHLREKYPDKLELVEEFIAKIEGSPKIPSWQSARRKNLLTQRGDSWLALLKY
jgi:hypothetical protein